MQNNNQITASIVGDIAIGCENTPKKKRIEPDYSKLFASIIPFISQTDLVIANLEGPFPVDQAVIKEKVNLYNKPEIITLFQNKYKAFCLCNNHIFDYGEKSFLYTKQELESKSILTFGAGMDNSSAALPLFVNINEIKLCLLAFSSDDRNIGSKIAGKGSAGVISFKDIEHVKREIEKNKKLSDCVCVSLHWGNEYLQYPEAWQIDYARKLIDFGASIVIGHHPHVVQGYEYYKDGLIMYSVGNMFIPPIYSGEGIFQVKPKENSEYSVFKVIIKKNERPRICDITSGYTKMASILINNKRKQKKVIERIELISQNLKRQNYVEYHSKYVKTRKIEIKIFKLIKIFYKIRLTPSNIIIRKLLKKNVKKL